MRGAEVSSRLAIFAPAKTPQPVVDRLVKEMSVVMQDAEVRQKLGDMGTIPMNVGGKDLDKLIADEHRRWSQVLQRVSIPAN